MREQVTPMCAMHTLAESLPPDQTMLQDILMAHGGMYRITVERLLPEQVQGAIDDHLEQMEGES